MSGITQNFTSTTPGVKNGQITFSVPRGATPLNLSADATTTVTVISGYQYSFGGNSSFTIRPGQSFTFNLVPGSKNYTTGQVFPQHNDTLDIQGGDKNNRWHLGEQQYETLPVFYYATWNLIKGLNQITYGVGIYAGLYVQSYQFWLSTGKPINFVIDRMADPNRNFFTFTSSEAYQNVGLFMILYGNVLPTPPQNAISPTT